MYSEQMMACMPELPSNVLFLPKILLWAGRSTASSTAEKHLSLDLGHKNDYFASSWYCEIPKYFLWLRLLGYNQDSRKAYISIKALHMLLC